MTGAPVVISDRIVFTAERLRDCVAESGALIAAHFAEIAHYPDIPLAPNWLAYGAIEDQGGARLYTVRDAGALVGYALFVVRHSLHYSTSLQATQDVLYLTPTLRRHLIGARFIAWCDEQLRAEGVQVVYHHVKLAYDFGPLLARLGYEPIETVWGRRLDKESPHGS